ncbi:hypothetical protein BDE02_02G172200 [Populus trichocarpa]|nr:hypothetical protein BDE02_02G172200 [Populus trichocarpa]
MEQRLSRRSACLPEASPTEFSRANKELRKLRGSMDLITYPRTKQKEIDGLRSMMAECPEDKDVLDMANEELIRAMEEEKRLQNLLLKSLLPKDDADERDYILEVGAGTGGEEASLFAMDIFKMRERFSQKNDWKFEAVDIMESDLKGYKEASAAISGADVFGKLKFESGIHRVQRVPVTEKSGCVHMSAVSFAILPQADEMLNSSMVHHHAALYNWQLCSLVIIVFGSINTSHFYVQLRNEELRIGAYRSGGSGGQHANTTNSAVRITHLLTRKTVSVQDERSQHLPFKVLCAKLYEMERSSIQMSRSRLRSERASIICHRLLTGLAGLIFFLKKSNGVVLIKNKSQRVATRFLTGSCRVARLTRLYKGESLDVFIDAFLLQQEMDLFIGRYI